MEKVIDMIKSAKTLLAGFENGSETNKEIVSSIESTIGKEIPYEIKSFLVNNPSVDAEELHPIFLGYEPIDIESISKMYADRKSEGACFFLGAFLDLSEDFVLGEDEGFEIIQDLNSEIEDGEKIYDMKNVVPIMDASGYYIVLLYKPDGSTEIAIATEDYCLSSLAPSLEEYLDNLELGISKAAFELEIYEEENEFEIEAPEIWKERVEAVA
ncbi:SMI1/KNR4 family protein [Photobacterium leiognathi]|uniref:SMI1/KNR4 family protein n=1 Tax=Photobacterium leiognathi TaxID=553611 RepID=UPI002981846C|nr:SMI1/KNR4 family protein [Photobacterium leiognathi]